MNLLKDIITYVRRIIKTPSDTEITDDLIVDYINRFYLMDVDARIQLFDLKTQYQFQTTPGIDKYNMPLYSLQYGAVGNPGQTNYQINYYPVYQGFLSPAFVNGIQVPFYTIKNSFYNIWPNYVQNIKAVKQGDGTRGPYTIQIPLVNNVGTTVNQIPPGLLRGYVDISGVIAANNFNAAISLSDPLFGINLTKNIPQTSIYPMVYITSQDANGNNIVVQDSGQYLLEGGQNKINYGLLMSPGTYPNGYSSLVSPTGGAPYTSSLNTVNYITGEINVYFPTAIPQGQNINIQCYFYEPGLPRAILFENNCLTLRNPPDSQYLVQLDAYLTPAAFLNLNSSNYVEFAYMTEYLARGAARKILSDTGDIEQFAFYEPLFKEQELLVWKRSQRQFTANRSETIYSNTGFGNGFATNGLYGSGAT